MLSIIYAECNKKALFAGCHYAEWLYAECLYAECHYAECRYSECRGALITTQSNELKVFGYLR
jgi:hypothetical protein